MNLSKSQKRIESKKRKISAFLQVAQLNDEDKKRKIIEPDDEDEHLSKARHHGELPKIIKAEDETFDDLRQRLKARKKLLKYIPTFELKTLGANAEIDMPDQFRTPLFMRDVQELFLYALLGSKAQIEPIRWCKFTRWIHVKGVVCLIIEGLGLRDFIENREGELSTVAAFLKQKLEFLSPGSYDSKIAHDFSLLPIGSNQRERLKKKYGGIDKAIDQGSAQRILKSVFPMKKMILESKAQGKKPKECLKTKLLLSLTQMISEGYPVPLEGELSKKYKNFVMTKSEYTQVTDDSPLFAIDCEMCLTSAGANELTRICVVDSQLNIVYHTFVMPKNPIRNYLTMYSGITKEMLEGVTTTIEDVQMAISNILPPDAILVGQSLNSDLIAMKMMHPYVIDTSVIYCVSGDRSRKTKLSVLAKMFLGIEIQHEKKGMHIGHDPKEDAEAAMRLVKLKLENGYSFGDVLLNCNIPIPEVRENKELLASTIFNHAKDNEIGDVLPNCNIPIPEVRENKELLASTIFNQAKDNNQSICIVGEKSTLDDYRLSGRGAVAEVEVSGECEDNDTVRGLVFEETDSSKGAIRACKRVLSGHSLTICHVNLVDKVEMESMSESKEQRKSIKYAKKWTEKIWSQVPENGLFVTVWPGDANQNAFVGIGLNKAKLPS